MLQRLWAMLGLSLLLFSIVGFAQVDAVSKTEYPIQDPLLATLSAAANGTSLKYQVLRLEPLPQRRNIQYLENRNIVPVPLFLQSNINAPIAFIVAGLGGGGTSGISLRLAQQLFEVGYTVISLPDPVSWQYVLGVSQSGVPGYLPRDATEFYEFMKFALSKTNEIKNLKPNHFSLVGYSYGGLLAAHLAKIDSSQKYFQFQKIVMINPAVDLLYGSKKLDAFYDSGSVLGSERQNSLLGSISNAAQDLISNGFSEAQLLQVLQKFSGLSLIEKQWLIGQAFRENLRDIIYVTDLIHSTGLLKAPIDRNHTSERQAEAKNIDFRTYISRVLLPSVRKDMNINLLSDEQIIQEAGLYPLLDTLENDSRIFLQESADDLLLQPSDLEIFRQRMKNRFYLYPFGGHLGNIWFEQNKRDLQNIINK